MSAPTREALLGLYTSTLRTSRTFASYNFRNYFVQRTEANFRAIQNENDPTKLKEFYEDAKKELDVLKRAALINQMYGGRKLVVETGETMPAPETMERSDN